MDELRFRASRAGQRGNCRLWRDASQRSVLHSWNWLARFCIGALWWQQSLWKLPPTYTDNPDGSGGLRYWMGEMVKWASTGLQRS